MNNSVQAEKVSSACWESLALYLNAQIKNIPCQPPKDRSIPVACQYYKVSALDPSRSDMLQKWKMKTKQSIDGDQKLSQLYGMSILLCNNQNASVNTDKPLILTTANTYPRLEQHPQKTQIMKLVLAIHEPVFVPQSSEDVYKADCDNGIKEACTLQALLQYRNGTTQSREKTLRVLNLLCDQGSSLACIKNGYYSLVMGHVGNAQVMYRKACELRGGSWCTINQEVQKLKDTED